MAYKERPAFDLWPDDLIFRLGDNVITPSLEVDKEELALTIDHLESRAFAILGADECLNLENVPRKAEGESLDAFRDRQRAYWSIEVLWIIGRTSEVSSSHCAARVAQSCIQVRRAIAKGDGERAAAWSMMMISCALQEQFSEMLKDIRKIGEVADDD